MEKIITDTIKILCSRVENCLNMDDNLKHSQSALNLAHALATLNQVKKDQHIS